MRLFLVHIELIPLFVKFQKFLPSFSGLQLDLEVNALNKITSEITRPITCIIGDLKFQLRLMLLKI